MFTGRTPCPTPPQHRYNAALIACPCGPASGSYRHSFRSRFLPAVNCVGSRAGFGDVVAAVPGCAVMSGCGSPAMVAIASIATAATATTARATAIHRLPSAPAADLALQTQSSEPLELAGLVWGCAITVVAAHDATRLPMRTADLPTTDATAAWVIAVGSLERRRVHEVLCNKLTTKSDRQQRLSRH
jgi:hypothetical protein